MLPPWTVRLGAALLGAAAGAVAVGGLVTAGPGLPGQHGLLPQKTAASQASAPTGQSNQAKAAQAVATTETAAAAPQLAALEEDVSDAQDATPLPGERPRGAADTATPSTPAEDGQSEIRQRTLEVAKGDTLMKVLLKAGSDRREAHAAVTALSSVYDLRRLMPGQTVTVAFRDASEDGDAAAQLTDVVLRVSPERDAVARLDDGGEFTGEEIERQLETRPQRAAARIDDSLYLAAQRAGVPAEIILEMIRLYSFDIDFQRDIQPGDSFEVLYESLFVENGDLARQGDILYARLTIGGTELPLYRYRTTDDLVDYFNEKGESVRKALMKTPIDGARLSSRFGKRRHPVLGYTKMHRGVDFAAPSGTPIMAAGRGTVEMAGWNGSYGRYIRIRHNGQYKTAYAHMSRIARGVVAGKRVRQGQIIGYVGTTGRSTGPHLHYEVHADGRQINPLGLKLPSGRKLKGQELARFQDTRERLDAVFAALPQEQRVAQSRADKD